MGWTTGNPRARSKPKVCKVEMEETDHKIVFTVYIPGEPIRIFRLDRRVWQADQGVWEEI